MDRLRNRSEKSPFCARFEPPGCTDPRIGRSLIAYSLDRLTPEQEFDFEVHMMECDHCFDALCGLDQIEHLVRACVDGDLTDQS